MVLVFMTLRISLRKFIHLGHLKWESTRNGPMARAKFYGAGSLGMGDTIYLEYGGCFTDTVFPKRVPCFGMFMRR